MIIVLLFTGVSNAQVSYLNADKIAASVQDTSIGNLHKKLIKNLDTDEEKVRAFYFWIAHHIRYDINEATRSFRTPYKQEPSMVLKTGRAVCHGYSALFKELCDRSGIKCYLVSGFTKLNDIYDEAGHTWDLVFINNKWQQVDATWAAGGVDDQGKFIKQFSEEYFLVSPDKFLTEHYPFDPMWQLKINVVTLQDFKKGILVSKTYQKFYFNDTIAAWEQLNPVNQMLSSAQRMNSFNPGNKIIGQELSFALLEAGNSEFEKGNVILNTLFPHTKIKTGHQPKIEPQSQLYFQKLDSVETYFMNADIYYSRIKPDDTTYGSNYSERAKLIGRYFRQEHKKLAEQIETPEFFKEQLFSNFIFKGPILEWYMKIKVKLEKNYNFYNNLIPKEGKILDIGCGYGFLAYMLGYTSKTRTVTGIDYDEEKIEIAQNGYLKGDNVNFIHTDITGYKFDNQNVILLNDVLHYLREQDQQLVLDKCVNAILPGGMLVVRDGVRELHKRQKGTWLTELFSTKILGFNKTNETGLHFISRDLIKNTALKYNLSLTESDTTKFTSNIIFILKKSH